MNYIRVGQSGIGRDSLQNATESIIGRRGGSSGDVRVTRHRTVGIGRGRRSGDGGGGCGHNDRPIGRGSHESAIG